MIHADQLNAIAHHIGLSDGTQLNHPRAAYNLLGYTTDCTSFTKRTTSAQWIEGLALEWPIKYALYKQYIILNREVQTEDEKKVLTTVTAPADRPRQQEKHTVNKSAKVNHISMTVAEDAPVLAEGKTSQANPPAKATVVNTI